jgi:hypothetical protein
VVKKRIRRWHTWETFVHIGLPHTFVASHINLDIE